MSIEPPPASHKSTNVLVIRSFVKGAYDIQKLRVSTGNRIAMQFKTKLGIKPGEKEPTLAPLDPAGESGLENDPEPLVVEQTEDQKAKDRKKKEAAKILNVLRLNFRKLMDGIKKELPSKEKFTGNEIISEYSELCLLALYIDMERREDSHFRRLEGLLNDVPIWTEYLKGIHGCGPAMAGVIISEFDPHLARHVSSFWKYAGLDVVVDAETGDGSGRSRRKEHLIKRTYIDKNKEEKERDSITFNPWLKTKLYVLATCLIKSGGVYKKIYDDYKFRLQNSPKWKDKTVGHRHNASMRYMIKMFLADLWTKWRTLEGLEVSEPYSVAKLGMNPHGTDSSQP
jgi:hypothetical protein